MTHPHFQTAQFGQISAHSASTVRAGEKVQLALIGSLSRAFQRAIDEPCTLPLSPQRVAQNAILLFLPVKFNFCRKTSATKFLCLKTSSKAKVRGGSARGRSETTGVGFVKEVGFKPGVKKKWSYRCTKWWIRRGRSDGWRNRWVGNGRTGTRMRFTKRQRKLTPETRWGITKERSVIVRQDDKDVRARVTTDEERVLRGRWMEMRLWRYGLRRLGIVVRTL